MDIDHIIDRRVRDLGGGFMVGRVLPFQGGQMVGPFIFFDQMGPVDLQPGIPGSLDVRPHPHIGLATVTYLYSGALTHRDSVGGHQEILPGEVNWMVAGHGITHSERFERARARGARVHGIQAWVALPVEHEEAEPAFHHREGRDLPQWREEGVSGRLIAGEADGLRATVPTHSPLCYLHWEMEAGSRRSVGIQHADRAVYVASGSVELGDAVLVAGKMAVLSRGRSVDVRAREASDLMVLGGEPVGPRFIDWNFVSSSKDRLEQAKEDWRHQRMALPVGDDREFIPLPGDRPPPAPHA